jgi:hypothetical protein
LSRAPGTIFDESIAAAPIAPLGRLSVSISDFGLAGRTAH